MAPYSPWSGSGSSSQRLDLVLEGPTQTKAQGTEQHTDVLSCPFLPRHPPQQSSLVLTARSAVKEPHAAGAGEMEICILWQGVGWQAVTEDGRGQNSAAPCTRMFAVKEEHGTKEDI